MKLEIIPSSENVKEIAVDVIVVGATSNGGGFTLGDAARNVDKALDGKLKDYLNNSGYKAKVGSTAVIPTFGKVEAGAVAVVGLGKEGGEQHELRRASGVAARKLSQFSSAASTLHEGGKNENLAASAEGYWLGSYRFTEYKSDPRPPKLRRIHFLGGPSDGGNGKADLIKRASAKAHASIWARDLTNEPASTLSPEEFSDRAQEIADNAGLEFNSLDENELSERKFGGLLGVAQGSARPPRLIELRYTPANATGKVALVGKGVTYDSGGLSLKDAKSMETMKTDMAGGAAVVGAMSALPLLDVNTEVIALVPATENMPGGFAIKPGDVLRHYGGQTSEVLNTDAEGRLILADALAYASEQEPAAIVDVATLTGAMMVALGRKAVGYFANDEGLAKEIQDAADRAGERFWRMPLYDDYRSDLDSEIADIKNTGARWGGAIYGALYLRDFVADGIPWAHLDIAGPGRAESDYDEITKGGSGVAARTLIEWVEGRS